jgi:hypothetical protein
LGVKSSSAGRRLRAAAKAEAIFAPFSAKISRKSALPRFAAAHHCVAVRFKPRFQWFLLGGFVVLRLGLL